MGDDIAAQLRKALDGTLDLSPSVHRLLHAAAWARKRSISTAAACSSR